MRKFLVVFSAFLLLPTVAMAQTAAPQKGDFMMQLPIFAAIFALFYFALIRPQKQQQKKHAEFVNQLKVGDEVVTSSGIIGTIAGLNEKIVTLEINPDNEMKVLRAQVQGLLKDLFVSDNTAPQAAR